MQALLGKNSVIISGSWNPAILSPEWLNANIYKEPELQTQIGFAVNDATAPFEIFIKKLRVCPRQNRLDIFTEEQNPEALGEAISLARNILNLLNHTPVMGVGINFGFIETADLSLITSKFELLDIHDIDQRSYKLQSTAIKRSFQMEKNLFLNLAVEYSDTNVIVDFNFHRNVSNASDAVVFLGADQDPKAIAAHYHTCAQSFLNTVYNCDIG